MGDQCKLIDESIIPKELQNKIVDIVNGISVLTKEQIREGYPDLPQEAIDDLYESHVCKAICTKSKAEYEKYRAEGLTQTESARHALVDELISLRDKGVLPDDIATENVIREILNGTCSDYTSPSTSRNLKNATQKFRRASGENGYKKTFTLSIADEKLAKYYLDIIEKFDMNMGQFMQETMDFYIEMHQQELEEIERSEDAKRKEEAKKKEDIDTKNSRLFG